MATAADNLLCGVQPLNYYDLLQVERNASEADIEMAYQKMSLMYHPDKTHDTNSEEVMKILNEAKAILLDEVRRLEYDDKLDGHGALCDPKGFLPNGNQYTHTGYNHIHVYMQIFPLPKSL